MNSDPTFAPGQLPDQPLDKFSHTHEGIFRHLQNLEGLDAMAHAAAHARDGAAAAAHFFRDVVCVHHAQEEQALFEAVMASAEPGPEAEQVQAMVKRLTLEHRQVENLYERLEIQLKKMAKGQLCQIEHAAIKALVLVYQAHAEFEEAEFLPLARTILSRNSNHMAALSLSLHVRSVSVAPSAT
jgi:hemerythrin-like domain-containing protein